MEGVVVGLRYERDGTINITMATDIHAVGDDGWKTMELDRIDD